jgi:hypothetical protein
MASPALNKQLQTSTATKRRYEHYFFSCVAILMLATVLTGFAKTYFLAGLIRAPLPTWIIHLHGAAFSAWILLFVAQVLLVAGRRIDWHRKLGKAGFLWACMMVVLGLMAATDLLRRGDPIGGTFASRRLFAGTTADMFIFATLIYFAYRTRSEPAAHKRFAVLATTTLVQAATVRLPFAIVERHPIIGNAGNYVFVLLLVGYDLLFYKKIYRATAVGGIFVIVVQQLEPVIGSTQLWQSFAAWAEPIVHAIHGA